MSAPNAVGTGNAVWPGALHTAYPPMQATNASDRWSANGASAYQRAPIALLVANTPGQILAGVAGKKIVVVSLFMVSSVANSTCQFQDETAVTPVKLTGVLTFSANGQLTLPFNPAGWFSTAAGAALDLATVGTVNVVGGALAYFLE